ncbi:MAG: hypothetical protein AAFX99_15210, partial [Myxococcota bacterium]
ACPPHAPTPAPDAPPDMHTDTALRRNAHYPEPTDTLKTPALPPVRCPGNIGRWSCHVSHHIQHTHTSRLGLGLV